MSAYCHWVIMVAFMGICQAVVGCMLFIIYYEIVHAVDIQKYMKIHV